MLRGSGRSTAFGLDLGQKRDYTALALVERSEVVYQERSAVTYKRFEKVEYRLRFLERLELGLPYPDVVAAVDEVVTALRRSRGAWANAPGISLVVDATGVGAAVVDLLRRSGLGCDIAAVTITGGEHEIQTRHGWNVPKRDLVSELQVMYEHDELLMAADLDLAEDLIKELSDMEVKTSEKGHESFGAWRAGTHDDLVLAVALAVWKIKKRGRSPWGAVRLI